MEKKRKDKGKTPRRGRKKKRGTPKPKYSGKGKKKGGGERDIGALPLSLKAALLESVDAEMEAMVAAGKNPQGQVPSKLSSRIVLTFVGKYVKELASKKELKGSPLSWLLEAAIARASEMTGLSTHHINTIIDTFNTTGNVFDGQAKLRAERAQRRKKAFKLIPRLMYSNIDNCIRAALAELKGQASIKRVYNYVKSRWLRLIPQEIWEDAPKQMAISVRSFYKFIVMKLGYFYCPITDFVKKVTAERRTVVRNYLILFSRALELEAQGTHKIVYMDESYIHQHHCSARRWVKSGEGGEKGSKGPRLIIIHAMTSDGLLVKNEKETRKWWNKNDDLSKDILSCEFIFPAGKRKEENDGYAKTKSDEAHAQRGDYHNNMDGHMFMLWLRRRLVPTFRAAFPERKMILCLDNARYHHGHGDKWLDIPNIPKYLLYDVLDKYEDPDNIPERFRRGSGAAYEVMKKKNPDVVVKQVHPLQVEILKTNLPIDNADPSSITFKKRHKESNASSSSSAAGAGAADQAPRSTHLSVGLYCKHLYRYAGPTFLKSNKVSVDEMRTYALELVARKDPEKLVTELEHFASEHDIMLMFTPPYSPDLQPIEVVWAIAKGRAAGLWIPKQKLRDTFDNLCKGFYGGATGFVEENEFGEKKEIIISPISTKTCKGLIKRVIENANRRIKNDPEMGLSGTIEDLLVGEGDVWLRHAFVDAEPSCEHADHTEDMIHPFADDDSDVEEEEDVACDEDFRWIL